MIDLHAHILPGIDDGAQTLAEALKMLTIAEEDGITKLVATPHLYRGKYQQLEELKIKQELEKLRKAAAQKGLKIDLLSGAEVHITHKLLTEIRRHRVELVINGSDYLFLEFPSDHVFPGVKNLMFELLSQRLIPIIAHPERNAVFLRQPRLLAELIQMGVLCQVNSGSFLGCYGERIQVGVLNLLKLGLVHFIASDCHNSATLPPRLSPAVEIAAEIIGPAAANALVVDNPQAVVENRAIPYYPEPLEPRERSRSLKFIWPVFNFFSKKKK